jgi:hypothetical protein
MWNREVLFGFGLGMLFTNAVLNFREYRKKRTEMSEKNKNQKINANY